MKATTKVIKINKFQKPLFYSWCWMKALVSTLRGRIFMMWMFHMEAPHNNNNNI